MALRFSCSLLKGHLSHSAIATCTAVCWLPVWFLANAISHLKNARLPYDRLLVWCLHRQNGTALHHFGTHQIILTSLTTHNLIKTCSHSPRLCYSTFRHWRYQSLGKEIRWNLIKPFSPISHTTRFSSSQITSSGNDTSRIMNSTAQIIDNDRANKGDHWLRTLDCHNISLFPWKIHLQVPGRSQSGSQLQEGLQCFVYLALTTLTMTSIS